MCCQTNSKCLSWLLGKRGGTVWGGIPPLGYDTHPDKMRREPVINETKAEVVHRLFDLYARHGCLARVVQVASRQDLRSKRHRFSTGRVQGGTPLSRGQIYYLLTNAVYRGLIRHQDTTWPGEHPAIITEELWERVQARLMEASARRRGAALGSPCSAEAPLKGKLRYDAGDLLTPSHSNKRGRCLRYYISVRV